LALTKALDHVFRQEQTKGKIADIEARRPQILGQMISRVSPYKDTLPKEICSLDACKIDFSSTIGGKTTSTPLGQSFSPGLHDVICARGKQAFNHIGNKQLRAIIELSRDAYGTASTKAERSAVVSGVVEAIRANGAGFVKQEKNGQWIAVSGNLVREKVGQQLREAVGSKYKSSHIAKKRRRYTTCSKVSQSLEEVMQSSPEVSNAMAQLSQALQSTTSYNASSPITDDQLMQLFDQANVAILNAVKRDTSLVRRFQQASISVKQERSRDEVDDIAMMETELSSWAE
jgi:hypothetical protein